MGIDTAYPLLNEAEPSDNLQAVADYWSNNWDNLPVRDLANLTFLTEVHGSEDDLYNTEWDKRVFGGVNSPEFNELMKDAETEEPTRDYTWFAETSPVEREPKVSSEVESYTADVEMNEEVSEALDETNSYLKTHNVIRRDDDRGDWNLSIVDLRNEVFKTDEFDKLEVDQFKTY